MTTALTEQVELGDDTPTALYRLFDAGGSLLYIGISDNLKGRFAQHAKDKPWWLDVAKRTAEWHPSRDVALAAETDAIRKEHPRHNVKHAIEPTVRRAAEERTGTKKDLGKRWIAGFMYTFANATPSDLRQWHEQMIEAGASRLMDLMTAPVNHGTPNPIGDALNAGLDKAGYEVA